MNQPGSLSNPNATTPSFPLSSRAVEGADISMSAFDDCHNDLRFALGTHLSERPPVSEF